MKPTIYAPFLGLVALAACSSLDTTQPHGPAYTTYETLGDSLSIAAKLDEFRVALGGVLNAPNTPPAASGRREINWDGVARRVDQRRQLPGGLLQRQLEAGRRVPDPRHRSPGRQHQLRRDQRRPGRPSSSSSRPRRLFMPVGSNQVDVQFQVVGTTTNGLVNGFGVVFSDVDRTGSTTRRILRRERRPDRHAHGPQSQGGAQLFSFIGAVFASPIIARVRITSGDAALNATIIDVSAGGTADLVVMDDFVYGEPQPLPQ